MKRSRLIIALLWPLEVLGALAILPLVAVGAGMAAAGVIGGLMSNKKSKTYQPVKYDKVNAPDAGLYQYGGSAGYSDQMRQQLANRSGYYGGRNFLGQVGGGDDYRAGLRDYRSSLVQQGQTREQQQALAAQLAAQARGEGPSLAGEQMKAGTEQAALNALNIAATSRGGGAGGALAAQDANALAAQRANRDAAMARIQEVNDARGQYAGLLDSIRGQDQAAMQAGQGYAQLGLGQQNISLQQQGLQLQQAGMNDEMVRAMLQNELAVNAGQAQGNQSLAAAQMQAGIVNQGAQLQSGLAAQGLNSQAQEAYRQRMSAIFGGLAGAGGSIASMGMAGGGGGGGPANLGAAQSSPGYQNMVNQQYQNYMNQYGGR